MYKHKKASGAKPGDLTKNIANNQKASKKENIVKSTEKSLTKKNHEDTLI